MLNSSWRIPINLKLVSWFSSLILLISFFNFTYYPKTYKDQALANLNKYFTSIWEMIALTSGISWEVLDLTIIGSAVNWVKKDDQLVYIGIFDSDQEPLSTFNPDDIKLDVSEVLKTNEIFELNEKLFITIPIIYNKTIYGKVLLGL